MRYSRNSIHYERLRAWLVQHRHANGLSIRALAEKLGIHHSIVGKIEDGSRKLDLLEFIEYCDALNVDPHYGIDEILNSLNKSKEHKVYSDPKSFEN